jgi:hypothetical protein
MNRLNSGLTPRRDNEDGQRHALLLTEQRATGRPREFDKDRTLQRALELFWSRGYGATSIQDLVDALGVERGSLYGAFGDKRRFTSKPSGSTGRCTSGT